MEKIITSIMALAVERKLRVVGYELACLNKVTVYGKKLLKQIWSSNHDKSFTQDLVCFMSSAGEGGLCGADARLPIHADIEFFQPPFDSC